MRLQACLNGARTREEHRAVPLSARELAADAVACARAGADGVHVHPRDGDGRETLDCLDVVTALRAAVAVEVGVSTGEWIEPDLERRLAAIRRWIAAPPDVASVNFCEEGAGAVCRALGDAGVQVEAGLADVADAERFLSAGVERLCRRVLVEVADPDAAAAVGHARAVEAALDSVRPELPRLLHGEGRATWAVLGDALARGRAVRVGLEDVLELPDGSPAPGNADLVQAVATLGAAA